MKHKLLFSALLASCVIAIFAFKPSGTSFESKATANADKGIQFIEADWNKAIAEARKQKKLIFIDAYTTWCGPCRMLKQNTFTDKAVGDFFNKNFINISLDMERGDGLAFAAKYQINAYPTLMIVNADQTSTTITEGYMGPADLLKFGKSVFDQKRN